MTRLIGRIHQQMKHRPVYDPGFAPIELFLRDYRRLCDASPTEPLVLSLERAGGYRETRAFRVLSSKSHQGLTWLYVDRLLKSLLWIRGGYRLVIDGPDEIVRRIRTAYADAGVRGVDIEFLERAYGRPFDVLSQPKTAIPATKDLTKPVGGHRGGCRIGFDAGGSVKKVVAVQEGEIVYRDSAYWLPKEATSIDYLYQEILASLLKAKEHLPRLDSFGISTAGIVIDRSIRVSSLIRRIPKDDYGRVKTLFHDLAQALGDVKFEVINDGEVSALAGAASLDTDRLLGITMGTSQGGGYVDGSGHVSDWLNELCFVPVDVSPEALIDEWSKDRGVGVSYFSQDAIIKLARSAGISLTENTTPSEQFRSISRLLSEGNETARQIFSDIGTYLGYTLPFYRRFYDAETILLMGGVMSGRGGEIIIEQARQVLRDDFPELADVRLETLSDEALTLGLAVAAAGLTP